MRRERYIILFYHSKIARTRFEILRSPATDVGLGFGCLPGPYKTYLFRYPYIMISLYKSLKRLLFGVTVGIGIRFTVCDFHGSGLRVWCVKARATTLLLVF